MANEKVSTSESKDIKGENNSQKQKSTVLPQEINKNLLLMNYVYDNSLEQIRKMDLKQMNLNFLEEFKHIPLDNRISPLILACYLGRSEIVKTLCINTSINIDLGSDDIGFTALSAACMSGFYEIAEFLIKKGADVNKKNNHGQTPFYHCFTRLEEESNYFENKRLCLKLADLLLDNGANIDEVINEKKGYTMLMVFCSVKVKLNPREMEVNKSCIKYLIENGANQTKLSKKGKSIFQLLEKHQNQEQITSIIKNSIVKRLKTETDSDKQLISTDATSKEGTKKSYARVKIEEEACKMEGITRESSTCCSIFSFF
ncbi:hypothetical protein ABPG74_018224 [Tetrahymena malaccensis]